MVIKRNRTSSLDIDHVLYLYFLGLSTRSVSKALLFLHNVKRSHIAIWKWIQKYHPRKTPSKNGRTIEEFIVDETLLKVGPELIWLWIAIEPESHQILAQTITQERNMFIAERFLLGVVRSYGNHPVSTDGGTWYPMVCQFLRLDHHVHSPLEKSLIERTIQYIKDRTESFDDYFPCRMNNCKWKHVRNWLNLFVNYHNEEVIYA
ncbi:MAG: DDE-type integrase/transposase/recombinase [Candidatus Nitrosocosmicus sp.]|nr:DDE-type integrase/transposase/recombinase [Candidatus Nitrosocosmicus sp.]